MKSIKIIPFLCLILVSAFSYAQNSASVTITSPKLFPGNVSLILEDVRFHPNLGIGLADAKMETVGSVNLADTPSEKVTIPMEGSKMVRMQLSGSGSGKTWMLFLQPGDDLIATFPSSSQVTFTGKNAAYQTFLQNHFLANHYQYLPVFGYKPAQIDNKSVIQQSDSLKQARIAAFQSFKSSNTVAPAFEAYVNAVTETEPALTQRLIQERIMRKNRVTKLEPAQQKELEDLTLSQFKVLSDDALLSQSYRDELRNWILIPSTRKFPLTAQNNYEISGEALKDVYQSSKEKLANQSKQKEYLLTYWLNYAATAIPTLEPAKTLLSDYQATFPGSEQGKYLAKLLETKASLQPGAQLPELTLLDKDSTSFSTGKLVGKPTCMVFAFSIGQHEPALKTLEEKYKGKVNFVYVLTLPGIPFTTWKRYATERADTKHLWATDANIEQMKEKYAIDIRYPFLITDASGKIVNRWIPQEFPNNKTLDATIASAIK